MQLSELKLISASNIIKLRTGAGLTQAELGEKLNYSDKTISKWERGEAIPDAYVLTQMAEIFGVTVIKVTTINVRGKAKRTGAYPMGKTASWKKAVVKLSADSKNIELFEGMA